MKSSDQSADLQQVLDQVQRASSGEEVSVGSIVDSIADRGFGPLLLVPALISVSPIGAIPGMSVVTGSLVFVVAFQMLIGRKHPWIPKRLAQFKFSESAFERGIERLRPWVSTINGLVSERWRILLQPPMKFVTPAILLLLSASYYPLALVPFGVLVPGLAIIFYSIGLTVRDGVIIALGHFCTCIVLGIIALYWAN
jgi:hypothetical protein